MKQKSMISATIALGWSILISVTVVGLPETPSRDKAEKAIRAAAYEMMKAFLTQDVTTFKRHSAKRTTQRGVLQRPRAVGLVDCRESAWRSGSRHDEVCLA